MNRNQIKIVFASLIALTTGLLLYFLIDIDFSIANKEASELIPLISLPMLLLGFSFWLYGITRKKGAGSK